MSCNTLCSSSSLCVLGYLLVDESRFEMRTRLRLQPWTRLWPQTLELCPCAYESCPSRVPVVPRIQPPTLCHLHCGRWWCGLNAQEQEPTGGPSPSHVRASSRISNVRGPKLNFSGMQDPESVYLSGCAQLQVSSRCTPPRSRFRLTATSCYR